MCRLADNHWIAHYDREATQYEYPPDIGFFRDIDPTIIAQEERAPAAKWMSAPEIMVEAGVENRIAWPFVADRGSDLEGSVSRTAPDGRVWLTAYEHQHASEPKKPGEGLEFSGMSPYGLEEFRFVCLALVRETDREELVQSLDSIRKLDVHSWRPPEFTGWALPARGAVASDLVVRDVDERWLERPAPWSVPRQQVPLGIRPSICRSRMAIASSYRPLG